MKKIIVTGLPQLPI